MAKRLTPGSCSLRKISIIYRMSFEIAGSSFTRILHEKVLIMHSSSSGGFWYVPRYDLAVADPT